MRERVRNPSARFSQFSRTKPDEAAASCKKASANSSHSSAVSSSALTSASKPSGGRGAEPSSGILQVGQGMPAPPQSQPYGPSHGRRGWFSQTHPVSAQKMHFISAPAVASRHAPTSRISARSNHVDRATPGSQLPSGSVEASAMPLTRALLPVLHAAIDHEFSHLDCRCSTYRGDAGFDFAGGKPDLPSPAGTVRHLHNTVFDTLVFHSNPPQGQRLRGCYGRIKIRSQN